MYHYSQMKLAKASSVETNTGKQAKVNEQLRNINCFRWWKVHFPAKYDMIYCKNQFKEFNIPV